MSDELKPCPVGHALGRKLSNRLARFPALQLPLDSFPDEVRTLLAIGQRGIDPRQRSLGDARGGLFVIDLLPAHATGLS